MINIEHHADTFVESLMNQKIQEAIEDRATTQILRKSVKINPDDADKIFKIMSEEFAHEVEESGIRVGMVPLRGPSYGSLSLSKNEDTHLVLEAVVVGDESFIERIVSAINRVVTPVGPVISWIYNEYMNRVQLPLDVTRLPVDEMYPFINRPLHQYYEDFKRSSANIMICIGSPGTGKTTFLRGMLADLKLSASVSYEQKLFDSDGFFANFVRSDSDIMIIEDADILLTPRTDGNSAMQRFLNTGDGLVSSPMKKIVFTSNLPNVKNIDPALIRSGRCFDVLHFRKLTSQEVDNLCNSLGEKNPFRDCDNHTLAEVMTHIGPANE